MLVLVVIVPGHSNVTRVRNYEEWMNEHYHWLLHVVTAKKLV